LQRIRVHRVHRSGVFGDLEHEESPEEDYEKYREESADDAPASFGSRVHLFGRRHEVADAHGLGLVDLQTASAKRIQRHPGSPHSLEPRRDGPISPRTPHRRTLIADALTAKATRVIGRARTKNAAALTNIESNRLPCQSEKLSAKTPLMTNNNGATKPAAAASAGVTHNAAESRSPTPSLPRRDAKYASASPTRALSPNGVAL